MASRLILAALSAPLAYTLAIASCVTSSSPLQPYECANGGLCLDAAYNEDGYVAPFDANVLEAGFDSSFPLDTSPPPADANNPSDATSAVDSSDAAVAEDASDATAPIDAPAAVDASDAGSADANDGAPNVAVALVTGQNQPSQIAIAAGLVYWANAGDSTLWREPTDSAPGDGGAATAISFAPKSAVVAMTADVNNTYFVTTAGDVFQVSHTTTTAVSLGAGQTNVSQMITDGTFVYWTVNTPAGYVGRAAIGGGPDASAISPALAMPRSLTLAGGTMYVALSSGGAGDAIVTLNPDGGAPATVLGGQFYPGQLCNDGTYLFFTSDDPTENPAIIYRTLLNGTSEQTLSNSAIHPYMLLSGTELYTLSASEGTIIAFNTTALTVTLPYRFPYATGGIAADSTAVYWTDVNGGNVWVGVK
jgi:hypothetical protein